MALGTGLPDLRFLILQLKAGGGVRPQVQAGGRAGHLEQENGQIQGRERGEE